MGKRPAYSVAAGYTDLLLKHNEQHRKEQDRACSQNKLSGVPVHHAAILIPEVCHVNADAGNQPHAAGELLNYRASFDDKMPFIEGLKADANRNGRCWLRWFGFERLPG